MIEWVCPYCYTSVPDGADTCAGCFARATYPNEKRTVLCTLGFIGGFIFGAACFSAVVGLSLSCLGGFLGAIFPIDKTPTWTRKS